MPLAIDPDWLIFATLLGYSAAVILASVLGGLMPEWIRLTHNRMQIMISFVGGVMLGIAVFHMIPHSLASLGAGRIDQVMWGLMLGMLATFFLLRSFHFHQHGPADFGILAEEQAERAPGETAAHAHDHAAHHHSHAHSGDAERCEHGHPTGHDGRETTRWMAVLTGLGLHTLMDGVALSSGVVAEVGHLGHGTLPGFGIFLAVLLHKPLDAVSITSLMHPVTTPNRRMLVNIGFALMCPLGAFLFWIGANQLSGAWGSSLAGWGLAFSAGVFLCISLSDLLPEMEFHSHSRFQLTAALLLGIMAAVAIGLVEGEHAHDHAIEDYSDAIRRDPKDAVPLVNRAAVNMSMGKYEAAVEDYTQAIELSPESAVAINNRGYNYQMLGKESEALADYTRAVELAPKYLLALQNKAWLLTTAKDETVRDPAQAIATATAACEISEYKDFSDLTLLAAAHGSAGEFETAIGWQEKSLALAIEEQKPIAQKLIALYQKEKPFDPKSFEGDPVPEAELETK